MMEQKVQTITVPKGSASIHLTPIRATIPKIAAFSNEAVKTFVGSRLRRILQGFDDLIHPVMGVKHLLGQGLSSDLVELTEASEHQRARKQAPLGSAHTLTMMSKSEPEREMPYCLPVILSLATAKADVALDE